MVGCDQVRAPMGSDEAVVASTIFDRDATIDHGDEMGAGDIVQYIPCDWTVDTTEEQVTIKGRTVSIDVMH